MDFLKRSFLIVVLIGMAPPGNCGTVPVDTPRTPVWAGPPCHHSPEAPCCRHSKTPCCKDPSDQRRFLSRDPGILPDHPQAVMPSAGTDHDPVLFMEGSVPLPVLSLSHPNGYSVLRL